MPRPNLKFRFKSAWRSFRNPQFPFRTVNLEDIKQGEEEGAYKAIDRVMAQAQYGRLRYMRDGSFFTPSEIRRLAGTSPVRTCVLKLRKDVAKTPWNVTGDNKDSINKATKFLRKQNMPVLLSKFVQDILEVDAGVIVKVPSKKLENKLVVLNCKDGAAFTKELDKYGRLGVRRPVSFEVNGRNVRETNYFTGYWMYSTNVNPIPFNPSEIVYTMMYPRSDSPYGESPVENLKVYLNTLVRSMSNRLTFYKEGGMPSGIMGFEEMSGTEWKKWTAWYEENIKGQPHKVVQAGKKPFWIPFSATSKDMQFLEEQHWFHKLTFTLFGVPPAVVGFLEEVPKATIKEQREIYLRDTLYPLLKTVETAFNVGVIPDILFGLNHDPDVIPDVQFNFDLTNEIEQERLLEVHEKELKTGLTTVNRILEKEGKDKVSWGDINMAALPYVQNIGQSYFQGAINIESAAHILGVPVPKVEEILGPKKPPKEEEELSPRGEGK